MVHSFLNHWVKIDENGFFPKLGITQALLQTLSEKFQNTKISTIIYSMCVLTGLRDDQCDRIMKWFFWASVSDCSILRLCRLLLCTLPFPSCYYNLHHSYHTSSSAHLGVPRLRPSISVCHTRSFAHIIYSNWSVVFFCHLHEFNHWQLLGIRVFYLL